MWLPAFIRKRLGIIKKQDLEASIKHSLWMNDIIDKMADFEVRAFERHEKARTDWILSRRFKSRR